MDFAKTNRKMSVAPSEMVLVTTPKHKDLAVTSKKNVLKKPRETTRAPQTQSIESPFLSIFSAISTEYGLFLLGMTSAECPDAVQIRCENPKFAEPIEQQVAEFEFELRADALDSGEQPQIGKIIQYVAFVRTSTMVTSKTVFVFTVKAGIEVELAVHPVRYPDLPITSFQIALERFSPMLGNLLHRVLPSNHRILAIIDRIQNPASIASSLLPTISVSDNITGHFDLIANDMAEGWAWNTSEPSLPVSVEILAEGRVVAEGKADLFRADLQAAGIGDGHHHFQIRLPFSIRNGETYTLNARVAGTNSFLQTGAHVYRAEPLALNFIDMIDEVRLYLLAETAYSHHENYNRIRESIDERLKTAQRDLDQGLTTTALGKFQSLLAALGPSAIIYCKIGECCLLEHRVDEALTAYMNAFAMEGSFADAYLGAGNCYARQQCWPEAGDSYQKGLLHNPLDHRLNTRWEQVRSKARKTRAALFVSTGDPASAIPLLKEEFIDQPADHEGARALACALRDRAGNPRHQHSSSFPVEECALNLVLFDFLIDEIKMHLESNDK